MAAKIVAVAAKIVAVELPDRAEIQVVAAAREIADRELVIAATRLGLAAFHLAKLAHAPRAILLGESGVVREQLAGVLPATLADPPAVQGASMLADLQAVMSLLQQGRVDLGFLEAQEVDRFGNANASGTHPSGTHPSGITSGAHSGTPRSGTPRSGSATDIACLAGRTVILLRGHERGRFPERLDRITAPGHGEGQGWRRRVGLPGGGPVAIITDLAVLRFDTNGESYLASLHPGVTLEEVQIQTGWPLRIGERGAESERTSPPTVHERNLMMEIDPEGRWIMEVATARLKNMQEGES